MKKKEEILNWLISGYYSRQEWREKDQRKRDKIIKNTEKMMKDFFLKNDWKQFINERNSFDDVFYLFYEKFKIEYAEMSNINLEEYNIMTNYEEDLKSLVYHFLLNIWTNHI